MLSLLQPIGIVIPIIIILMFGFFAAKKNIFQNNDNAISILSKLVLTVTLPPVLFAGTLSVSRTQLHSAFLLFLSLLISTIAIYLISFFIAKIIFKRNVVQSSLAALGGSFSAGPFYGPALLEPLYGGSSSIAISMMALVINLFLIPLATIIIEVDEEKKNSQHHIPIYRLITSSIYNAIVYCPYVWAPLLAIILLLCGIQLPDFINNSCLLIGKATSGIAVFVAGMTIAVNKFKITTERLFFASIKDIALPALFLGVAFVFSLNNSPTIFNEGLLLCAMPSGPMTILLSNQYKQYQEESASILAISTFSMIITVSIVLGLIH
ncbi:AEC family transporter [Commensalibacter oyaizuii]|uniref:AEC family transporter n=1 Tax=Commensalibacter oyaizuii TaxID=3043873 RepID=A0ABT6Q340_9PROT|nr:AEC family transporter [Commensalibacter sp. TBRC 16381]MDI2091551.1 AEC family transporter [Commensalibacter sp. TBRC 16381]